MVARVGLDSSQIGFLLRSRDDAAAVCIHCLALARGPFLEESQVESDIEVLRADSDVDGMLHEGTESIMRSAYEGQDDEEAGKQAQT